jgi:hypothetical protein
MSTPSHYWVWRWGQSWTLMSRNDMLIALHRRLLKEHYGQPKRWREFGHAINSYARLKDLLDREGYLWLTNRMKIEPKGYRPAAAYTKPTPTIPPYES